MNIKTCVCARSSTSEPSTKRGDNLIARIAHRHDVGNDLVLLFVGDDSGRSGVHDVARRRRRCGRAAVRAMRVSKRTRTRRNKEKQLHSRCGFRRCGSGGRRRCGGRRCGRCATRTSSEFGAQQHNTRRTHQESSSSSSSVQRLHTSTRTRTRARRPHTVSAGRARQRERRAGVDNTQNVFAPFGFRTMSTIKSVSFTPSSPASRERQREGDANRHYFRSHRRQRQPGAATQRSNSRQHENAHRRLGCR